ncbi:dihydrodipicolinate synthase family protein [Pseudonocardia acaciae]|uniref:dihydrodipicolinate synthase family protein n=1 Tax=Pseudonocardia acaciae TaxID=551276 RepID=UPI000490B985|nr:dihydrodipicolinate synthase family protein [Pseudonocardia acaciae]
MPQSPAGVLPVLAMPFTDDGEMDLAALAGEIEWVLAQRVDGVVLGMVSEVLRLSSEERDLATERTCAVVAGRATVTASVGAESLHTAVRHARRAEASGADAVMAIPPLGTACDDGELLRYYSGIFDAIGIPVVVQDASGYVGRPLSIEVQATLLREYGDRALFKPEAQPIGPRLSALRDATGGAARVYEGSGGLALVDSFARGVVGTMPGPDVCWALVALWRALQAGDQATVDAINGPLTALVSIQSTLDSFVAVQKHLLRRQGALTDARSRGPVGFILDPETEREVDRRFDLLAAAVNAEVTA